MINHAQSFQVDGCVTCPGISSVRGLNRQMILIRRSVASSAPLGDVTVAIISAAAK